MTDENVWRNILVTTRALWMRADGHSTDAGVGRSWKVAETYVGATTVVFQPHGS